MTAFDRRIAHAFDLAAQRNALPECPGVPHYGHTDASVPCPAVPTDATIDRWIATAESHAAAEILDAQRTYRLHRDLARETLSRARTHYESLRAAKPERERV